MSNDAGEHGDDEDYNYYWQNQVGSLHIQLGSPNLHGLKVIKIIIDGGGDG